ncbi:MAG: thioredoxin [Gammaproteobacteria bacterium]|nr:thioredoxin [Gammaproteobacteria bacterium]
MNNIVDITLENAQQVLIEASKDRLVVADFWADWCEPCKQLMPILEKLAHEFSEQIILAKVNCDEQQQIAGQFGVRNLPTVALLKDGQPVDGFAGVQPESEIRELLQKHLPKPQDEWFAQGVALAEQKDFAAAYPLLQNAFDAEPDNKTYKLMLANVAIELGKLEQAEDLLSTITMVDQDAAYKQVLSKLDLAKQASETPEIQALQTALAQTPDAFDVKFDLAVALSQANRNEEALQLLFDILKVDLAFGDAKKVYLDIIANLPDGDALAGQYRRKLYALLY